MAVAGFSQWGGFGEPGWVCPLELVVGCVGVGHLYSGDLAGASGLTPAPPTKTRDGLALEFWPDSRATRAAGD